MEIIDAQIHQPECVGAWSHGAESLLDLSCELAREAMDCVGVDAALIVAQRDFYVRAIERDPTRFRACHRIDVARAAADPVWLHGLMDEIWSTPNVAAVRLVLRSWRDGELVPGVDWDSIGHVMEIVASRRFPMFVQAAGHWESLERVVATLEGSTVILDHLGLNQQPSVVCPDPWKDLPKVERLARYPHVAVKLSGAITLSREKYPHEDLSPVLTRLLDAYSARRLMWGSDFTRLRFSRRSVERGPRDRWYGLYSDSVGYLRDSSVLSDDEKKEIFSGSIKRLTRWYTESD